MKWSSLLVSSRDLKVLRSRDVQWFNNMSLKQERTFYSYCKLYFTQQFFPITFHNYVHSDQLVNGWLLCLMILLWSQDNTFIMHFFLGWPSLFALRSRCEVLIPEVQALVLFPLKIDFISYFSIIPSIIYAKILIF